MKDQYSGVYEVKDTKGNIVKGKYVLRMCITVNGVTHRDTETVEASSKKKAYDIKIKRIQELKDQYSTGTQLKGKVLTFGELVDKWKSAKADEYSPTTYSEYLKLLDNHIMDYFKSINIKEITKGTIYNYMDYKKQNTKLSDKSIRNQVMLVSTILTFAEEREFIQSNPCIRLKLKKEDTKIKPKYFTYQQMKNMIKLADKLVEEKVKSFDDSIKYSKLSDDEREKREHLRLLEVLAKRLFVNLCIITGSRRGEVLGLKWDDVEFGECANVVFNGTAYTVVGQGTKKKEKLKNGNESKILYLSDSVIPMLKEYKTLQNKVIKEQGWKNLGFIFLTYRNGRTGAAGQLARPNTYTHWFKEWLRENKDELGLDDADVEFGHVHTLRHSFASYILDSGVPVSAAAEMTGHEDKKVLLDTYGHGYTETKKEAAKLFDSLYVEDKEQ